jgi:NAD(P)H-hydrate epimerase
LLAGVIGARLAIGDSGVAAAALGAWVCGRAAEIAISRDRYSEESLLPTDLMETFGAAFEDWRASTR